MHEDSTRFSLFRELKHDIKGTDADYTSISVRKAIFLFAVPMVLELVMESGTFRRILGGLYIRNFSRLVYPMAVFSWQVEICHSVKTVLKNSLILPTKSI